MCNAAAVLLNIVCKEAVATNEANHKEHNCGGYSARGLEHSVRTKRHRRTGEGVVLDRIAVQFTLLVGTRKCMQLHWHIVRPK